MIDKNAEFIKGARCKVNYQYTLEIVAQYQPATNGKLFAGTKGILIA